VLQRRHGNLARARVCCELCMSHPRTR
jgi:hypothetical protein